jgi:hypothetical protein
LTELTRRRFTSQEAAHVIGSASLLVHSDEGRFRFVHQSILEWLVARHTANDLRENGSTLALETKVMSPLMAEFFSDLAGTADVQEWARRTLAEAGAPSIAKQNALSIQRSVGTDAEEGYQRDLSGIDLRGRDLTSLALEAADLNNAIMAGMVIVDVSFAGADMRGADLKHAVWMRFHGSEAFE